MKASELAEKIGGRFIGPSDPDIISIAPINEAQSGDISFIHNPVYRKYISETSASCVVLDEKILPKESGLAIIVHNDPHGAMALAVDILYPETERASGIDRTAIIDASSMIGENVSIGANAFIGPACVVGDSSSIGANSVLMSDVHLGPNCVIYPNVSIYPRTWLGERCIVHSGSVLGSDGFGFAPTKNGILKIRQVGKLIIEQEVEIGANCTIDRGSFTETRIGRGTKLDNLVHVGHNCKIGEYCLIAAQTGVAGSTIIGNRVMVGGQVGFAGHQKIGDGSILLAKSGVQGDIPPGSKLFGYPAKDSVISHREAGYITRLASLFKRVKALEKLLDMKYDNTPENKE